MSGQSLQEVRVPEDNWTGLASAAERRKLQNRLNQRLYRKRRRAKSSASTEPDQQTSADEPRAVARFARWQASTAAANTTLPSKPDDIVSLTIGIRSIHDLDAVGVRDLITKYENLTCQDYILGSPRVDQLLTLIQFNVFRALISNGFAVGLSMEWLDEDAVSPWYVEDINSPELRVDKDLCDTIQDIEEPRKPLSAVVTADPTVSPATTTTPSSSSAVSVAAVPPHLLPTSLQRSIRHHPWFDLFPFPRMRDNLLLSQDSFDEWALCNDLVEFCDVPYEKTGLIVWREPWDPSGWEVSEAFLGKWAWVVEGCSELRASTNYWRRKRGEKPLRFDEVIEVVDG